jgi:AraC family carnitine catabolism transcriptional activator
MPHVCLVTFPRFQMLAYVLVTETLRIANKHVGRPLFTWETRTATGAPLTASNGASVAPDWIGWDGGEQFDLVLLCAGYDPLVARPPGLGALLAQADRAGAVLGGLDTGSAVLARLGYLAGHKAVLHHEAEAGFRESWPEIAVESSLYCFDNRRLTAAGGLATADAMLAWIASVAGPDVAEATADDMAAGAIRPGGDPQRQRTARDPVLREMDGLMRMHLAEPLPLSALAERLRQSPKQLRALCRRILGLTPTAYYLRLRLDHALNLLRDTDLTVTEIAFAVGFGGPASFSRSFRSAFGSAPTQFRMAARRSLR